MIKTLTLKNLPVNSKVKLYQLLNINAYHILKMKHFM